jgi:hypothetical protein
MERVIIIGGLILQSVVAKFSPLAGGVVGTLVTVFIAAWGASVYSNGGIMVIFSIELPKQIFFMICMAWAVFDIRSIVRAAEQKSNASSDAAANPAQSQPSALIGDIGRQGIEAEPAAVDSQPSGDYQSTADSSKSKEDLWHELTERFESEGDEAKKREIAKRLVDMGFLYYRRFM